MYAYEGKMVQHVGTHSWQCAQQQEWSLCGTHAVPYKWELCASGIRPTMAITRNISRIQSGSLFVYNIYMYVYIYILYIYEYIGGWDCGSNWEIVSFRACI